MCMQEQRISSKSGGSHGGRRIHETGVRDGGGVTPTETATCKRRACWQSVRTESREWVGGSRERKEAEERREIGICQVEARKKNTGVG